MKMFQRDQKIILTLLLVFLLIPSSQNIPLKNNIQIQKKDINIFDKLREKNDSKLICNFENTIHNTCIGFKVRQTREKKKRRRSMKKDYLNSVFISGDVLFNSLENKEEELFTENFFQNKNDSVDFLVAQFKTQWPVEEWRKYLFTDDYLFIINPHWLKFPPPSRTVSYALAGLYIIILIVGFSGNFSVILMYIRCRSLRTPGNILVVNLAVSDFFMLAKVPVFVFNSFHLGPALGKTGCFIYAYLGGLTGCCSIATLACISLDRYWAIVKPLDGLRSMTAIRARVLAVGAWIYAAMFATVPALDIGYGRYVPEGYLTSCSFDYLTEETKPRYFIFAFFCAAWVVPFLTITFCYVNILKIVVCDRNVAVKCEARVSSRHIKEQVKRKAEVKLAILVIAVIALFFVSWTPYAVVSLLGIFGMKELITPTVSMVPALFCKTAACINPFIYIINHPKFRKAFRKMICGEQNQRFEATTKSFVNTELATRKGSRDFSDDLDVEELEVKDVRQPHYNNSHSDKVKTVSGRVAQQEGSRTNSMKSITDDIVPPPSWFAKPKFTNKKNFQRTSTKSDISDKQII